MVAKYINISLRHQTDSFRPNTQSSRQHSHVRCRRKHFHPIYPMIGHEFFQLLMGSYAGMNEIFRVTKIENKSVLE